MAVSGNPGKTGTIAVERNKKALQQRHTFRGNLLGAKKEKAALWRPWIIQGYINTTAKSNRRL